MQSRASDDLRMLPRPLSLVLFSYHIYIVNFGAHNFMNPKVNLKDGEKITWFLFNFSVTSVSSIGNMLMEMLYISIVRKKVRVHGYSLSYVDTIFLLFEIINTWLNVFYNWYKQYMMSHKLKYEEGELDLVTKNVKDSTWPRKYVNE